MRFSIFTFITIVDSLTLVLSYSVTLSSRRFSRQKNHVVPANIRERVLFASPEAIISPFDANSRSTATLDDFDDDDELPLTRENVELVLDEMRPYLKADGGNVRLAEIDGPVVKLELEGACGSCPSSSMTMKMGLERKLKERIPEIAEVIQSMPSAPALTSEAIETVLDGVRPFLSVAGGKISIASISSIDSVQAVISLKMEGKALALQSVKMEIMQRLQRHFVRSMRIDWVD